MKKYGKKWMTNKDCPILAVDPSRNRGSPPCYLLAISEGNLPRTVGKMEKLLERTY